MPNLKLAGNTIRMNVAFPFVNVLLRRQLLQNYVIAFFFFFFHKKDVEKHRTHEHRLKVRKKGFKINL